MSNLLARSFALGLVTVLLAAPGATADDTSGLSLQAGVADRTAARAPAPGEQLVSGTATFSAANRAPGMPTSTAPQHQIVMPGGSLPVTVDYGYDWQTGALTYNYSLDTEVAAPDEAGSTVVRLGFGAFQGNTCVLEEVASATVYRYIPDVLLYDNKDTDDLASAAGWNCAALVVGSNDPTATPYDAFVTGLDVAVATPQITLSTPRKDRLVPKVWTAVTVTVANAATSQVDARDLQITGAGKGVKVRSDEVGTLDAGSDDEAQVWVKLTRPKATVKFTATEMGAPVATTSAKLKQRPAPAAPKAGAWRNGSTSFKVAGGKIKGFRITTRTTCGGYPDLPTTTTNTYNFPTVAIPRNNEVIKGDRGNVGGNAEYSVSLRIEFVSRTKAKGSFSYYGPARCNATDGFTVKRGR